MSGLIQNLDLITSAQAPSNHVMLIKFIYTIIFFFIINESLGQRLPKDSFYIPSYNFTFDNPNPDYVILYERVRGMRLKLTKKTLDEGNDYRVRIKLNNRIRLLGDFIFVDLNPNNFFYSVGIGIKY